MIQRMKRSDIDFRGASTFSDEGSARLEIHDSLQDQYGQPHKRPKSSLTSSDELTMPGNESQLIPSLAQYNPLDEPSPLGLRLKKSPSLLDLIQMRLSQGNAPVSAPVAVAAPASKKTKKDAKGANATDKQKASNFPALLLRIGSWEYVSNFEGDLVAKFYFAKNKLVWEILVSGLKYKIEIQWSDILDLKAHFPDNGPGSLTVVLARQPLFFMENKPQPRKHTLWQSTTDFTKGQASSHRQHFLQCSPGVLNKHYDKLIKYDAHLGFLSQKKDIIIESPLFETQACPVVSVDGSDTSSFQKTEATEDSSNSGLHDTASVTMESFSFPMEEPISSEMVVSKEISVLYASEGNGIDRQQQDSAKEVSDWDKLKGIGMNRSMSISDLVNHIGHRISEKRASSGNPMNPRTEAECDDILENLTQMLMSDTQSIAPSDEQSLMSRINSFCCLLEQQTPANPNTQEHGNYPFDGLSTDQPDNSKQPQGMSRRDSLDDLLFDLPRIASVPKFLFDIFEDDNGVNNNSNR